MYLSPFCPVTLTRERNIMEAEISRCPTYTSRVGGGYPPRLVQERLAGTSSVNDIVGSSDVAEPPPPPPGTGGVVR